jgi:hypothetical protein
MNIQDYIKKNTLLGLRTKRNLLGDKIIGWNRLTQDSKESVSLEQAEDWLKEDIEKARKEVAKSGLDGNEIALFIAFYITRKRWAEAKLFWRYLREGQNAKAALFLTNGRWMRNNPSLGSEIGRKILKGEIKLT